MSDKSRASLILDWYANHFETLVPGTGDDDYKYGYSLVTRSPMTGIQKGKALAMGVYGGTQERTFKSHPKTQVAMQVILEIYYYREQGKNPIEVLEQLVQEAERRVMEDERVGGLAINCNVVSSVTEADGRFDNYSEAALVMEVLFQHHRTDPRRSV
jgi:hypothetical protein